MAQDLEGNPLGPPTPNDADASLLTLRNILLLSFLLLAFIFTNLVFYRIATVLVASNPLQSRYVLDHLEPTLILLVILGSGGHTAEMLTILRRLPLLAQKYTHRTYVVSSGDGFSAEAVEFEESLDRDGVGEGAYDVLTVHRARRVHQSLPHYAALHDAMSMGLSKGATRHAPSTAGQT